MVKKKSIYPYLLVAPALLIILCVVFIPVVNAIGMSFQSYDLKKTARYSVYRTTELCRGISR